MDKVVAKFKVTETGQQYWNENARKVKAIPVYSTQEGTENRSFSEATPSGELEILVTNPAAAGFFELGAEYYVTFEKASAQG